MSLLCLLSLLTLRGWRGLRFLEPLESHHSDEHKTHQEDHAAGVATWRAASAGPLRVEIRIANFGQRSFPVVEEWRAVREPPKRYRWPGWWGTPLVLW